MELDQLLKSIEGSDLEFKTAQGGLPGSLWETYSAFANTAGGTIFLGVKEEDSGLVVVGLTNVARLRKNLFDNLNDRRKVSVNLLREGDVEQVEVNGKRILKVTIPPAPRTAKPVYINGNLSSGTFMRLDSGDYRCPDEVVRRMIAESLGERDNRHFQRYGLSDLDADSISAYRNLFRSAQPDHPWLTLAEQDFLTQIGAWRRDRETGQEGATLAGLLMFGTHTALLEVIPGYQVDYREADDDDPDVRWTYRHTVDGRWSPNLFEFYRRTIPRLTRDIAIPFRLQNLQRVDDTHVAEALREALVNAVVHADHEAGGGASVVRSHQIFRFENPGDLRVSIDQAYAGGVSECRNPTLQRMFRMAGLGEQAGSGIPRIVRAWEEQSWRWPELWEDKEHYRTTLLLLTTSLLPEQSVERLRRLFGEERFALLGQDEVTALVTADVEGQVTKGRLAHLSQRHPVDAAELLKDMTDRGLLERAGPGRRVYTLPKLAGESSQLSLPGSPLFSVSSPHSGRESEQTGEPKQSDEWEMLARIAEPVAKQGWQRRLIVRQTIVELCRVRPLRLAELARLLSREPKALRQQYLNSLLDEGQLRYLYPGEPTHPHQAYVASD